MIARAQINIGLEKDSAEALEKLADAAHLSRTAYATMVLSRFAELKLEHGLDALTAIPKDFFKSRPGRPPSSARNSDAGNPALAQNTA